jgi:hypothetical protein
LTQLRNSVIRQLITDRTQYFNKIREFRVGMLPHHSSTLTNVIKTVVFHLLIAFGSLPQLLFASPRLPGVAQEMETPEYWMKKVKNPTNLLLTPEQIYKMNEEDLKRPDLRLCRIRDLKQVWSRDEILSFLKEDWRNFGRSEEVRYDKYGVPLGEFFWNKIRDNLNQDAIRESGRMSYALVVRRTDIRVFPTDELVMKSPNDYDFDRFRHSSISPGSPIGIYNVSRDKEWAYAQTPFVRGWIRRHDLAIAKERKDVVDYEEARDRLVITGNMIAVFGGPSLQRPVFRGQMGDSFPLLLIPGGNNGCYVIRIPRREDNGELSFRKGYIRAEEDVRRGFLPYTQENVARQAFKMLNHPYGWGDRLGGRDCSRFIMDLFGTFGILMPRNSKEQAMVGTDLGRVEGKPPDEKQKLLDQAIPLATILRLPGHIMLYLGKDKGKHYVIHSIWGIQKSGNAGPTIEKIGRAVVSDLSLGEKGPNRSLLDRITDIRMIGSNF